jgi:ComF family protein
LSCEQKLGAGTICEPCRKSIAIHETVFCGVCDARMPDPKKICHVNAPYLLGAAGNYENAALQTLIHALKFQMIRGAAEPLADIIAGYVASLDLDLHDYTLMPIPLSKRRERARGFNQSELIGKRCALRLGIPCETEMLMRIRHRKPQSETQNIAERRENIRGCFAARTLSLKKNVLLIDDVTTSGATFLEAARTLKAAGAKKIIALAAAKA